MSLIYKLLDAGSWARARDAGAFAGSAVDLADGYIHFSTAAQLAETARRHFHGASDLVALTVDAGAIGADLKWEPSRGGDLFPHLYAPLPVSAVRACTPITLDADGTPDVGPLLR